MAIKTNLIYNNVVLDLRGLDMTTPMDLLSKGHTPYAKNFRLYAQQSDSRQVAVSSAKGPGYYINPLTETLTISNTATTGASTANVGIATNMHAIKFTATNDDRLSSVDLEISLGTGNRPVSVQVYDDEGGLPFRLLSESSMSNGDISETAGYVKARFLNAIKLINGNDYWIVFTQQDDGTGEYVVSTTTAGTKSYKSNSGVFGLTVQTYSLNYKIYTSPDEQCKGAYRFNKDGGDNKTLAVYGTTMYYVNETTHELTSIATGLSASATDYSFTNGDGKVFWVNGYDDLKSWDGTTVETITDTELPKLKMIAFHKDRLFGVDATDPNKLVFSESPGNPSNLAVGLQWYHAWLSVSFIYVPKPYNGSPITKIVSFQDALQIFTQDKKYTLSGYDRGSFYLREATGSKGALSERGVIADENNIYFMSLDGMYSFNGSKDTKISLAVDPLLKDCPNKYDITPVLWDNKVRVYLASKNSQVNDTCLLYNKDLKEWEYDTDTYIDRALFYSDADDDGELIEISSTYPCMFIAEVNYNKLGAPIDFEYRFPYYSMGIPAQKKRIIKFYPIIQGVDRSSTVQVAMDKDFADVPKVKDYTITVGGAVLGDFVLGDGTLLGSDKTLKPKRLSYPGWAYYWQPRVTKKAVDTVVALVGAHFSYKAKRL